jgi:hypothetical protein
MLISLAYRRVEADRYTRAGHFKQEQALALMGIGCPGKTVGLIGLGEVALYMSPSVPARCPYSTRSAETQRLRLHRMRLQPLTHKLIGARHFDLMKPTAYLINTARGHIVDETELIRTLQSGMIAGAALNVYWKEPPVTYDPYVPVELLKLDNVILAPHERWRSLGHARAGRLGRAWHCGNDQWQTRARLVEPRDLLRLIIRASPGGTTIRRTGRGMVPRRGSLRSEKRPDPGVGANRQPAGGTKGPRLCLGLMYLVRSAHCRAKRRR